MKGLDFDAHIEPDTNNALNFLFDPTGWLYSGWSREKYDEYLKLNSVYPIRLYMDYLLDKRASEEYLRNHGMDYSDIHDPRKLAVTSSATALNGYVLNFVSRNISNLYK